MALAGYLLVPSLGCESFVRGRALPRDLAPLRAKGKAPSPKHASQLLPVTKAPVRPKVQRTLKHLERAPKRAAVVAQQTYAAILRIQAWQRSVMNSASASIVAGYRKQGFSGADFSRSPLGPVNDSADWIKYDLDRNSGRSWEIEALFVELDPVRKIERVTLLQSSADARRSIFEWRKQQRSLSSDLSVRPIEFEELLSRQEITSSAEPAPVPLRNLPAFSQVQALYLFRAQASPSQETFEDEEEPPPSSWMIAVFLGQKRTLGVYFPAFSTELSPELGSGKASLGSSLALWGMRDGFSVRYELRRSHAGLRFERSFGDCGVADFDDGPELFALLDLGTKREIPVLSLVDDEDLPGPKTGRDP